MAEVVQGILEDMTSDLIDLQTREIFTSSEIKEIIETRKKHEYKLARNKPSKKHFFSAISFELDLEDQRLQHKQELNSKPAPSDKSITRRILSLFRRFSKLHKSDVLVWKEYINFCIRSNSKRELSQVLAKCLQFHSRSVELWLISKCIEVEVNKNIESGRSVLQRALDLNPVNKELWTEYFKFEAEHGIGTDSVMVVFKYAVEKLPGIRLSLLKLGEKLSLPKDQILEMKRLSIT